PVERRRQTRAGRLQVRLLARPAVVERPQPGLALEAHDRGRLIGGEAGLGYAVEVCPRHHLLHVDPDRPHGRDRDQTAVTAARRAEVQALHRVGKGRLPVRPADQPDLRWVAPQAAREGESQLSTALLSVAGLPQLHLHDLYVPGGFVHGPRHNRGVEISTRQAFVLRKVVEGHRDTGQPVGSRWLAEQGDLPWGPSTIRAELARLEELGLLQHPHTSAGRVPTDTGYRHYVDELLEDGGATLERPLVHIGAVRQEIDETMRTTTEQLSQVTNLLAIVSAPPRETTTIRHVEVLLLQPQVAMVAVITSTG